MADPSLQSLCCVDHILPGNNSKQQLLLELHQTSYHALCLTSSVLGIMGSIYQLFMRYGAPFPRYQYFNVGLRGNNILFWLAVADLFSCMGLIFRSIAWLLPQDPNLVPANQISPMNYALCAVISAWIQFSFTSSHLWTLLYAVDVARITYDLPYEPGIYHFLAWGGSAALCAIGLAILYAPGTCLAGDAYLWILPNHIVTYLPILATCVAFPILFFVSFRQAEISLMRRYARYTTTERRLFEWLKIKFFAIVSIFYLCYLPNIFNGFILWTSWIDLPIGWVLANWYLMALLNPLNGLLNLFLYKIPGKRIGSSVREWLVKLRIKSRDASEEIPLLL